ncbi:MAG TPA: cyanophycin synthetase, partial [Candidatus Hydrogenedentes bacterium]|nr:cyanophycin synthetase [Candidatus Hydrogenedentota bacterium]
SLERPVADGVWFDGTAYRSGETVVAVAADSPLPGRHNAQNVAAALAVTRAGAFPQGGVIAGLRGFRGVEHRIEHVATIDGVDYYNDSKSTNVDSLRVAIESFGRPIVLIAGGRGKGDPYLGLGPLVRDRVKALITLGEDAPRIEKELGAFAPATRAASMEDAVRLARACAADGDIVLLSPACASFDMYQNFEERGRHFRACVREGTSRDNIEEGSS